MTRETAGMRSDIPATSPLERERFLSIVGEAMGKAFWAGSEMAQGYDSAEAAQAALALLAAGGGHHMSRETAGDRWSEMERVAEDATEPSFVLVKPSVLLDLIAAARSGAVGILVEGLEKISAAGPVIGPPHTKSYAHGFEQGLAWAGNFARAALTKARSALTTQTGGE